MNNQVTLIGNMGNNPNIFEMKNGGKIAKFDMVTTDLVNGKPQSQWHHAFCFGNIAQFISEFGGRGKKIAITGRLVHRTFVNRYGELRKSSEIEVIHVMGI